MPVFVQVSPDPFAENFNKKAKEVSRDGKEYSHVRRPFRGIQIKDDTYATLEVMGSDGFRIPLVDAGGIARSEANVGYTDSYSNFVIQNLQEQRNEKVQVVETFGEWFAFFFGERPRTISVSGALVNTADFNWRAEFWENYDKYLRGTRCVMNKARVHLSWDDVMVEGYITNASAQDQSEQPYIIPFSFQMLLTNYANLSSVGNVDFPAPFAVNIEPGLTADTTPTFSKIRDNRDEYIGPYPLDLMGELPTETPPQLLATSVLPNSGVLPSQETRKAAASGDHAIIKQATPGGLTLDEETGLSSFQDVSIIRRYA